MRSKSSRNNDVLLKHRDKTTPKIYALLVELVNENREDLAEMVAKADYLIKYATVCIKDKDFAEAREALEGAAKRIKPVKEFGVNVEYLEYIYEGAKKKCK
ncbi:hypothetical protein SAMN02745163_00676 [Clostridium cavendishii DSM 21758]|uniref:Uncharacterized protein n=1 Tax=Clostridium cavendishii DSM 21758 TaxID=1121302 RepID=A0A1M6DAQ8_9CLOT|nr:hypothetical protein [Clostridium cavendishii]SHI70245.1 hypothetical protein SAMN02745163_00676 [Clostridium cavendishii DSM 21758]